jgi:D-alanyl-D-alanine carboxypeptidase/D-alanyl-D-alanine-endopeptidase (penicillin-binding protein 4)
MQSYISRRALLSGLAAFGASPALANAPEVSIFPRAKPGDFHKKAARDPEFLIADAGISGETYFMVADASTGLRLEGRNSDVGTPPASVAKALTALYALDALGAEHRFVTRARATGPVEGGVLKGDLVLEGGCDPTLDTDGLAALVDALAEQGVTSVTGGITVFDGALPHVITIDPGQPAHVGYSPAVSGIALNFNRVHFEWKRANGQYNVTVEARTKRYRPAVRMASVAISDRASPVFEYARGARRDEWSVARSALGRGGARWMPVRWPADYAGDVFRSLCAAKGIKVAAGVSVVDALPSGAVLAQHRSAPLHEVLRDMLKFSTNITAEMVGMAATRARGVDAPDLAASAAAMNAWSVAELGMVAPALVDHSGLSDASRLTAVDMTQGLVRAYRSTILRPMLKQIAIRDRKGRPQYDHPIKVNAKTGTLNFVSGLGGYMETADGRVLAFTVFTADLDKRAGVPMSQRESPEGAGVWNRRSKALQQALIERWGLVYGV